MRSAIGLSAEYGLCFIRKIVIFGRYLMPFKTIPYVFADAVQIVMASAAVI